MTKLVMVIPSLKTGGAERIFSFLANNLDRNIFDIYIIIFDGKNIQFEINQSGITIIDLKKNGIIKGVFSLIKVLRKIQPNVLFSTVTHLNILMGMLKPFFNKCRFVAREASVISINNKYQPFPSVFNFLVRFFYKRLDVIICQSRDMAEDLIKNYNISANKITTINNPITHSLKNLSPRQSDLVNFISVGRLIPTKGFERLIDIVSKFEFNFHYFIAGDGIDYSRLNDKIDQMKLQNKVTLLGKVDILEPIYSNSDFYLNGSYYEGFPNALLEASSYGLPIISFNTLGGINEIIIDGFNGFIADDEKEFSVAVQIALGKKWNRALIQKDIYDRFNKDKILSFYEKSFLVNYY